MYTKSARFYDALYGFRDYAAQSEKLRSLIQRLNPHAETLLDVACGTGKHLEHLRGYFDVEGLDLNGDLLQIAARRCPGVHFNQGDMVSFTLGRSFDVITCLFSSIGYVKTVENLYAAVARMAAHLRPQGIILLEPWFGPENYWIGRITANYVDQPDLKIAWMYISQVQGRLSVLDMNFLVGTPEAISHFTERHEMGLFTAAEYEDAFVQSGLQVEYDAEGLFGRGVYVGSDRRTR
jgi:ubiquinone/menaquinone biosynthesis C-methylase UbiE